MSFVAGYGSGSSSGSDSETNSADSNAEEGLPLKKFKPINFDEPLKNSVFSKHQEAADKQKAEEGKVKANKILCPPQVAQKRKNMNIDRLADRQFEEEQNTQIKE